MRGSRKEKFKQKFSSFFLMATFALALFLNAEGNLIYLFAILTLLSFSTFLLATRQKQAEDLRLDRREDKGRYHQEGSPCFPRARAPGKPNWAAK